MWAMTHMEAGRIGLILASATVLSATVGGAAQNTRQSDTPPDAATVRSPASVATLGDGPWLFDTDGGAIRVVRMAHLDHPWSLAFLPDGAMLVTERPGRLRLLRRGVLQPDPIPGTPENVLVRGFDGLLDVALHPAFAENGLIYLTYSRANRDGSVQTALFRARFDGETLLDGQDVFVANSPIPATQQQSVTSRIAFGPDGMIYMTVGAPNQDRLKAQDPTSHRGKVLRLTDDGNAPPDNPFIGKSAVGLHYQPEIFSLGHRNAMGLAFNPDTGELWQSENGPQSGDELNIVKPGRNYGWPYISRGIEYDGTPMPVAMAGMEQPLFAWSPNPAVTGMAFYTGEAFPAWKGEVLVGGLMSRRVERIAFNEEWQPVNARGHLLAALRQRIRDVRQGPDGLLYVLTDETDGALLRIEPAPSIVTRP